jgi:hypothetical protein
VMAQLLAAVPIHGLYAVLVAAELALESGKPSGEHVLNILARFKSAAIDPATLFEDVEAALLNSTALQLQLLEPPLANVSRYDDLRTALSTTKESQ